MSTNSWIPKLNQNLIEDQLQVCLGVLCLISTIVPSSKLEVYLLASNSKFKLFLVHNFTTLSIIPALLMDLFRLVSDRLTDWCGHEIFKFSLFNSYNGCFHLFLFVYISTSKCPNISVTIVMNFMNSEYLLNEEQVLSKHFGQYAIVHSI